MRLHLVNDEKIINRTLDIFEEVYPNDNLFVVMKTNRPFKWVKERKNVLSRSEFLALQSDYQFTHIYIHLLNRKKINLLKHLSFNGAKIYWIIWGLDLYNNLLKPKGFEMIDSNSTFARSQRYKRALTAFVNQWLDKRKAQSIVRFVEEKVDYIVTDTTDNDYDYLLKYYPQLRNKPWRDFFYYPLDTVLGAELMQKSIVGGDIMIGNSASMSNNHEYVMNILHRLDCTQRTIYVPLSYSIIKGYVQTVKRKGKALFGSQFKPLEEFLPLEEYNLLQQRVGVALYGNWRQEAIGNILVSLYLGAKVFLTKRNPVYEWALRHELTVFVLEDITQEQLDTPLSEKEQAANRTKLLQLYTKERMIQLIRAF